MSETGNNFLFPTVTKDTVEWDINISDLSLDILYNFREAVNIEINKRRDESTLTVNLNEEKD
jgi:hypothetical protein